MLRQISLFKKVTKNRLFISDKQRFFQTTLILSHQITGILFSGRPFRSLNVDLLNLGREKLSNLQQIKYETELKKEDLTEIVKPATSYVSYFPLFIFENGDYIESDRLLDVFKSVKLVSQFLDTKYSLDSEGVDLSNIKWREILEPVQKKGELTVLELFNCSSKIYTENKMAILKELLSESKPNSDIKLEGRDIWSSLKAFGTFDESTLSEVGEAFLKLRWDYTDETTEWSLNVAPLAINLVSFNLLLRGYMKYVHNRPFSLRPSDPSLQQQKLRRRYALLLFSLVGVPLTFLCLNSFAGSAFTHLDYTQDVATYSQNMSPSLKKEGDNKPSTILNSGLFLPLRKIKSQIAGPLIFIFIYILFTYLLFKLLGYSGINDFLNNRAFLRSYAIIMSSLIISYYILNLYLLHKFYTQKVKIPQVLPDFIINWFKYFTYFKSDEAINYEKKRLYIEITIYVTILILSFIVL